MRKISKGLAVAATVMALGGLGIAAVAQPAGPGYGPGGYGGYGYGPMGYMHGGYGMMGGWGGGYGMMGGWGGGYGPRGGWGPGSGAFDPTARLDAQKAALALRPDQTAAWDAYAKAVRDGAARMQAIRGSIDFDKLRSMSWDEHWAYMSQFHDKQAAVFQSIRKARDGLLAVLDDTQKEHLQSPGPGPGYYGPGMTGGYGPGMMGGYGPGPMMGPGYGMMWGWGGYR